VDAVCPYLAGIPVAQLYTSHRDRADAGLHLALRAVAVPNQALAPIRQPHLPHGGQERIGFRLDGLCQHPAGAVAQDGRERVVNRVGLTEGNNAATARQGVSAPSGVQAGLHTPRYAALPKPSSPRFGYSSLGVVCMTTDAIASYCG